MTIAGSRLGVMVSRGRLVLPETGAILAMGLPGDAALDWAGDPAVHLVQPDAAAHAALRDRDLNVTPDVPLRSDFAAALVIVPRSRVRARLDIAEAAGRLAPGGLLVVEGARTDGIDSLWRECRDRLDGAESEAKAHGRVFWGRPSAPFDDWIAAAAALPEIDGLRPAPGGFSADGADPGSALLAAALPEALPGRVADLGAGWGWLSARILEHPGVVSLDAVEADWRALEAARANLGDPRVRFHWADALSWRPDAPLDTVVTNPPFHAGRAADPGIGRGFIATAAASLAPRGTLWLVANRHLPYEATLTQLFQDVEERDGTSAFKILRAARPRRR